MEPISLTLTWPTRIAAVLMLGRGSLQALRDDEGTGRALLGGFTVALFLTAARAAEFDLSVLSRERYLLVALTLATLVAGYGLASLGRKTIPAVAVVVVLQLGVLVEGFFAPFAHDGGHAEPSMVVAQPDAKLQAARWMLERLGPGEKGLILAGDGWSYWPLVAFTAERMPVDFVPRDPEETAAILQRTTDRRRFLVDFHEWHWNRAIRAGLAAAGYSDQPAFQPTTPNGRPVLTVWELPPRVVQRPMRAVNSASVSTVTPSFSAFASLLPASAPATRKLGLRGHGARRRASRSLDSGLGLGAGHRREGAGHHHAFSGQGRPRSDLLDLSVWEAEPPRAEGCNERLVSRVVEPLADSRGDHRAHVLDRFELLYGGRLQGAPLHEVVRDALRDALANVTNPKPEEDLVDSSLPGWSRCQRGGCLPMSDPCAPARPSDPA